MLYEHSYEIDNSTENTIYQLFLSSVKEYEISPDYNFSLGYNYDTNALYHLN